MKLKIDFIPAMICLNCSLLFATSQVIAQNAPVMKQPVQMNNNPAATATLAPQATANRALFQQILNIYNNYQGQAWATQMSQLLAPNAVLLHWNGLQDNRVIGAKKISGYLTSQATQFPELKKTVGRNMIAGNQVGGGAEAPGSVLVLFYQGSAKDQKGPWVWAGCDIITVKNGKIVNWRLQEDTDMKLVKKPKQIDIANEYQIIDKFWNTQTLTNNLVGMSYLLDLKRTVMQPLQRNDLLLAKTLPTAEMSTWEPDGILLIEGKADIAKGITAKVTSVLPDFYENVERTLVSGNAFIMIQNPSGTSKRTNGTLNHRAWFNCDIYFFNSAMISGFLFQRDTLLDVNEENK